MATIRLALCRPHHFPCSRLLAHWYQSWLKPGPRRHQSRPVQHHAPCGTPESSPENLSASPKVPE